MSFSQVLNIYQRKPQELAEVLDVSERTIYKWLKENKIPGKQLKRISNYFNLSEEFFTKDLSYLECLQLRLKYCDLMRLATAQELEAEQMKVGASNG